MPRLTSTNTFASTAADGHSPVRPDPEIDFPEPDPPIDQCDIALGQYMRSWSQVERALTTLLGALLGTDDLRAEIVSEIVQQAALRDLMRGVGSHYLDDIQKVELFALLDELKSLAGIRNRLVHGQWTLIIQVDPKTKVPAKAFWSRQPFVTDRDTLLAMHDAKSQKSKHLKAKNQFPAEAVADEAMKLLPFARKVSKLASELRVSRSHAPTPRAQRRQAVRKPRGPRAR